VEDKEGTTETDVIKAAANVIQTMSREKQEVAEVPGGTP